ncbi:hypothetical protein BDW60DRAFT_223835 [Aspergillus nidulans var. acristatus]
METRRLEPQSYDYLNNAYVSGLQEDLNLHGNEPVELQTMYTVATSFGEMMAYQLFVGWFEAAFFPGMHYIFGAWYRGDEIARRGGCFYIGLTLSTLTASLIQAGTPARLDGLHGLAGWRWMYIIYTLYSPESPDKPNRLVINNWKFWGLLFLDNFFWNGSINTSAGGYFLWLKSLKRYSTSRLNELGAISPASALWFAFITTYSAVFMSSVLYGWVNEQLRYSPVERSITLIILNTVVQSTAAWTPLLVKFGKARDAACASDSDRSRDPESSPVVTNVEPSKID